MVKYVYDAWGNHKVLDANGEEITDPNHIGNLNPFRYRGYFFDKETGLYYLKSRYYDPVTGRFLNADTVEYLDPESINGLNLYAYCGNNPVMNVDPTGRDFWSWLDSGLQLALGIALCFVPGAQAFGISMIVSGTLSLTTSIISAAGLDGKTASIITNVLSIIGGIALCFTPFAAIGANMIGSGVFGIAGGYISESLGGSFQLGSAIGNIMGGILGGQIYKGLVNHKIISIKISTNKIVENLDDPINNPNIGPKQGEVANKIQKIQQTGVYDSPSVVRLSNGSYQIQNGHHTFRALTSLGYRYIWVKLV